MVTAIWHSIVVYLTAALPLIEGKGAVVLARVLGLPLPLSNVLCIAGSYTPVPFLLYGRRDPKLPLQIFEKLPKTVRRYVRRYGCWALLVMIAVPFTGLGCWLGALFANTMRLDKRRSALAIFVGNALAILLMTGCLSGVILAFRHFFLPGGA